MLRLVCTVLLVLSLLVGVWASGVGAQGELSLEGLAGRLQALTDRVDTLTERVEFIEAVWTGPGAEVISEDLCRIANQSSTQDASVLKYKETFGEWPTMSHIRINAVSYDEDSGHVLVRYEHLYGKFMVEIWDDCDFLEGSDWWEE